MAVNPRRSEWFWTPPSPSLHRVVWSRAARLWLSLVSVAALACSGGQITRASAPSDSLSKRGDELGARPENGPLLWRVRAPGAPTSHILGTIHIGVSAAELDPAVWAALDQADVFAMETDMESAGSPTLGNPVGPALTRTQWRSLVALVGLDRARAIANQPVEIAYGLVLQALFPQARPAMDLALAKSAETRGLELRYLESLERQVELANRYIDSSEVAEILEPESVARRELGSLVAAYRRGDVEAIAGLANREMWADEEGGAERYSALFRNRNLRWAEVSSPWLRTERCFIAVGAGHLVGEDSLLSLLRQRGFEVDRVRTFGAG